MSTPSPVRRWLPWLALLAGLAAHLGWMHADGWPKVRNAGHGRDLASYYYAVKAADQGLNPYDKDTLSRLARVEDTRAGVHPYFYPPPFLLTVLWVLPLTLMEAYHVWFWGDALWLLAAALALWWLVPRPATLVAGAVVVATFTPLYNNHVMGQANLPVFALAAWGFALAERDRPWSGGALMGLACMMKMSPALLVLWWLVQGRWRPVAAACGSAVLYSVMTLPLLDLQGQWVFYRDILPGFSSGEYGGLSIPITLFGNHSIPNLWAQGFGLRAQMKGPAALGASLTNLAALVGVYWGLRGARTDGLGRLCGAGALVVLMLIVPVYAYEHHFVMMLLPLVAAAAAVADRRLGWGWGVVLALAYLPLAWPLEQVKETALSMQGPGRWLLQEAKFFAAVAVGLTCLIGARR